MKRLLLLGLAGIVGCGDSEPDDALAVDAALDAAAVDAPIDAPIDAATTARVQATVSYAGSAQGALILASFASRPPMGPPAGFAQQATPTWPASLALENLQPGTAYVLALLDVPPASPTQPGPEDRVAWSEALTLTIGQTTTVALTLTDPAPAR